MLEDIMWNELGTKQEYEGIINAFLSKPFKFEELLGVLAPYLSSSYTENALDIDKEDKTIQLNGSNIFSQEFITQGAQNLGASEKLFIKHLGKFQNSYANSTDEIESLFTEKKYEEAHRLAHSIKGLSGTLSFFDLQEKARDLESYLKPFATDETARPCSEEDTATIRSELKPLLKAYNTELIKVCSKRLPE